MFKKKHKLETKKKSLFWRIYWIYTACLALAVIVLLIVLWNFLAAYENSRPIHAMEETIELIEAGDYDTLTDYLASSQNPYLDANTCLINLFTDANEDNLDYGKLSGKYTENHPVFAVTVNEDTVASFTFRESEDTTGFGFHKWELSEIDPMVMGEVSATISVPDELEVTINGIALADSDRNVELTGFWILPEVLVTDSKEQTLALTADENGCYSYAFASAELPSGYTLYVDEEAIDASSLTSQERPALFDFWSQLEDTYKEYTSLAEKVAIPTVDKYTLNFLCQSALLTAKDAAGNEYDFNYDEESNTYSLPWSVNQTGKEEAQQFAYDFMTAYTRFVSDESSASTMSSYFVSGSSYYSKMSKMDNKWFPAHSGSSYGNYACQEFTCYSDSLAFIKVSMDQGLVYSENGQATTIHIEMPLWLMKIDGNYYVAMIDYENYTTE